MDMKHLFNVKMHASVDGKHVSGSEKIVDESDVGEAIAQLHNRAAKRIKIFGQHNSSNISLKIDELDRVCILKSFPTKWIENTSPIEARAVAIKLLENSGIAKASEIFDMFCSLSGMRGAALVDIDTLQRLDCDMQRGVRVTRIDYTDHDASVKNHFREAVSLSTKVASAPGIVGELCITDDGDYPDGLIVTPEKIIYGMRNFRLPCMKGGRLFLFDRKLCNDVQKCIDYLENEPVIVDLTGTENHEALQR